MADAGVIAVVLGLERHPANGRWIAPRTDMAALAWAIGLGRPLAALSVGNAERDDDDHRQALHSYLGLGLDRLHWLQVQKGRDHDDALARHIALLRPALVLTGARPPEDDQSQLPFTLAHRLGMPLVQGVRHLRADGAGWQVDAWVGRAVRRLRSPGPLVVTLHANARPGRLATFAAARRGRIDRIDVATDVAARPVGEERKPSRQRPDPIAPVRGTSFSERFASLTEQPRVASVVLRHLSPTQAAAEILGALRAQRVGPQRHHFEE